MAGIASLPPLPSPASVSECLLCFLRAYTGLGSAVFCEWQSDFRHLARQRWPQNKANRQAKLLERKREKEREMAMAKVDVNSCPAVRACN